jgi:coproporphyrinogen III oxidase
MSIKEEWIQFILDLQNDICGALETCDGKGKFIADEWQRAEGGGGKTRVITRGSVFEREA